MKRTCEFCRGILEGESKFCPHCGAPVSSQPQEIKDTHKVDEELISLDDRVEFIEKPPESRPGLEKEVRRKRKFPLAIILALLAFFVLRPSSKPLDEPDPQLHEPEVEEPVDLDEPEEPELAEEEIEEAPLGWHEEEGAIYYYSDEGDYLTGWQDLEGERYYFSDEGLLQTGILKQDEGDYLTDEKGRLVYGLNDYKGNTYLTDDRGLLRTGWWDLEDRKYFFDKSGKRLSDKGGLIDFGRDPDESFIISSDYKEEIFLYENMILESDPQRSEIKSYLELPKIQGPQGDAQKLADQLDLEGLSVTKMRWDRLLHSHEHMEPYEMGYIHLFRNSIRVFDSGDISTLIIRSDEDSSYEDNYLTHGQVFFIDNYTGELVGPKEQIASLGEDPDEVLYKMKLFIQEGLGRNPAELAYRGDYGFYEFNEEAQGHYMNRVLEKWPFYLNPMESFEHEDVFLMVDEGQVYMVGLLHYFDRVESYGVKHSQPHFVRVPFNYEGGELELSKNEDFFTRDYSGESQDISDIFHFYYE